MSRHRRGYGGRVNSRENMGTSMVLAGTIGMLKALCEGVKEETQ